MALACLAVVADAAAGSNYQLACRRHSGTFVFIVSVVWPLAALTALFWQGGVGAGLNACWPKLQSYRYSFVFLYQSLPNQNSVVSHCLTLKIKRIKYAVLMF